MPSNGLARILFSSFLSTLLIANMRGEKKNHLVYRAALIVFFQKGEIPKTGQGIIVLCSGENMALFLIILHCETVFCCFCFARTLTRVHTHAHLG